MTANASKVTQLSRVLLHESQYVSQQCSDPRKVIRHHVLLYIVASISFAKRRQWACRSSSSLLFIVFVGLSRDVSGCALYNPSACYTLHMASPLRQSANSSSYVRLSGFSFEVHTHVALVECVQSETAVPVATLQELLQEILQARVHAKGHRVLVRSAIEKPHIEVALSSSTCLLSCRSQVQDLCPS